MKAAIALVGVGCVVERALVAWLEDRDIALALLTGPQGDPVGAALLGATLTLRFALVFGGPPLVAAAVTWWAYGRIASTAMPASGNTVGTTVPPRPTTATRA